MSTFSFKLLLYAIFGMGKLATADNSLFARSILEEIYFLPLQETCS